MSTIRFIAGSGRSGTTWVQDALAEANRLRPVFEPLHPYVSSIGNRYAHRALAADDSHPDLVRFLERVGNGGGPKLWTRYRQQWRWLLPPASRFSTKQDAGRFQRHWVKFLRELPRMTRDAMRTEPVFKCIRANLMLPWIAQQLDSRVVLIMRHPAAVVESELRGGWTAQFALARFRNDARLHELTGGRYAGLLARDMGLVESLTLRWVIENQWVAEHAETAGIPVFHYENLRSSNPAEWKRLCAALDLTSVPNVELLVRPSQQSGTKRTEVPIELSPSPRWMKELQPDQLARLGAILREVGYRTYSIDDPYPESISSGRSVASSHRPC
jgi:hypothetical protein